MTVSKEIISMYKRIKIKAKGQINCQNISKEEEDFFIIDKLLDFLSPEISTEAWVFPCEQEYIGKRNPQRRGHLFYEEDLARVKKELGYVCTCGNNCKPIKVKVTVEVQNDSK